MRSRLDRAFVKQFGSLPTHVRDLARKNFRLWQSDRAHPGLDYKQVHPSLPVYSVRVGAHHRAVGIVRADKTSILWFFIGSHAAYDKLLERL